MIPSNRLALDCIHVNNTVTAAKNAVTDVGSTLDPKFVNGGTENDTAQHTLLQFTLCILQFILARFVPFDNFVDLRLGNCLKTRKREESGWDDPRNRSRRYVPLSVHRLDVSFGNRYLLLQIRESLGLNMHEKTDSKHKP